MTVEITNHLKVKLSAWVSGYATINGVGGLTEFSDGDIISTASLPGDHPEHGSTTPYTLQLGAVLVGKSYPKEEVGQVLNLIGETVKGHYEQEREAFESATILEDGQTVLAGGERFRVRVVRGNGGEHPRNSDPIHFDHVDAPQALKDLFPLG